MRDDIPMWFRKRRANPDHYVVDTSVLTRSEQTDACRAALRLVRPLVKQIQCDVPWDNQHKWPNDVIQAASVLAPLTENTRPGKNYKMTNWVTDLDEKTWDAFVTFAPYAFTADALTEDLEVVFDVSDEGDRLSLRISPDLLSDYSESVADAEVVPANEWTRSRAEEWRIRINRRNQRARTEADGDPTRN